MVCYFCVSLSTFCTCLRLYVNFTITSWVRQVKVSTLVLLSLQETKLSSEAEREAKLKEGEGSNVPTHRRLCHLHSSCLWICMPARAGICCHRFLGAARDKDEGKEARGHAILQAKSCSLSNQIGDVTLGLPFLSRYSSSSSILRFV